MKLATVDFHVHQFSVNVFLCDNESLWKLDSWNANI